MVWVWVFLSIAVGGLVAAVSYAVWLWHKAADLFSELEHVVGVLEQIAEVLGEIHLPEPSGVEGGAGAYH